MTLKERTLIAGLPADAKPALISLLLWLADEPEPTVDRPSASVGTLMANLHDTASAVRDAITQGDRAGVLDIQYLIQKGAKIVGVCAHTNQNRRKLGKVVGRLITINWSVIKELQKNFTLPETRQYVAGGHTASVRTMGAGMEWNGQGVSSPFALPQDETDMAAESDAPVLPVPVSASGPMVEYVLGQMQERFFEAQTLRGVPQRKIINMVGGKKYDARRVRELLMIIPANDFWTSATRVINLFSFWAEHQPLTKLHYPVSVFASNYQRWLGRLHEWEAANHGTEFRILKAVAVVSIPESDVYAKAKANLGWLPENANAVLTELRLSYSVDEILSVLEPPSRRLTSWTPAAIKRLFVEGGLATALNDRRQLVPPASQKKKTDDIQKISVWTYDVLGFFLTPAAASEMLQGFSAEDIINTLKEASTSWSYKEIQTRMREFTSERRWVAAIQSWRGRHDAQYNGEKT